MPPAIETRIRVRYAETDQMGVVYYANYLVWMEVGRVELCRSCGFNYREMELEDGIFLAVAECNCRYSAPALPQRLSKSWCSQWDRLRLILGRSHCSQRPDGDAPHQQPGHQTRNQKLAGKITG